VLHFNGQFVSRKEINEIDLSPKDEDGYTLLHFAALENQPFVISVYLEKHYDILPNNVKHQTPIHLASISGSLDFIVTFTSMLAKETLTHEIDKPDVNGHTPLMLTAMNGHINVLGYLLRQNVNVNHQDIENDNSLLHLLVKRERNKALEYLLKWNAQEENGRLEINLKNKQGRTALHCAADCANEEAIYILCSFDADTSMLDSDNMSLLNLAIQSNCPNIERRKQSILALIKCGADYSQIDTNTIDEPSLKGCITNYIALNGPFRPSENVNRIDMDKITNLVFQGGSVKGNFPFLYKNKYVSRQIFRIFGHSLADTQGFSESFQPLR
jgi:ankyrin repeat protein